MCWLLETTASAVATPIVLNGLPVYALSMSLQDIEPTEALGLEIGEYLMAFAARCKDALSGQGHAARRHPAVGDRRGRAHWSCAQSGDGHADFDSAIWRFDASRPPIDIARLNRLFAPSF